jgi:DNA topoisomerase-3
MRLFIAEKPSLARAIVDVLPEPRMKKAGYFECGGSHVVTWCAGHILELAPPAAYDPAFKAWRLEDLPIVPSEWQLEVTAADLLKTIRSLLRSASRVVHAGDPDREGQLLVDEVLVHLSYRGPVDRLLVSDLNPEAVRKSLAALRPNESLRPLYHAALARQRADWLYGLNMTRLYTLLGRTAGYDGVLSVGRVQTPLLGLIVRRDLEVEAFKPRPYFVLLADVVAAAGGFRATWKSSVDGDTRLDEDGHLIDAPAAVDVQRRTSGARGQVTKCVREKKAEAAPLPYSLPELQVDAAKKLGLTPKQVLEAAQALYETHRVATYPRSDCSYLPETHFAQAPTVFGAAAANLPELQQLVAGADFTRRSRAWNDSKVTVHHAIIPTPTRVAPTALSPVERGVYDLIARRYLAQFYGAFEYYRTEVEVLVAGERFVASGRQPLASGWKATLGDARDGDEEKPEVDLSQNGALPALRDGQPVTAATVCVNHKLTQPPKRFTNATLLQAMTGIARFVSNPEIKTLLREADGIGTPATQAAIIQTLFERGYVEEKKRNIISTPTGRALISKLPTIATEPDMTALWEAAMQKIHEGQMPLDAFLTATVSQLRDLIVAGKASGPLDVGGPREPCARLGCGGFMRRRQGKHGPFLSCSRYPECAATAPGASSRTSASRKRSGRSGR